MNKWIYLFGLILTTQAFSMGEGHKEKGQRKEHMQKIAKELGLSSEQIEKLKSLKKGTGKETKALRQELKTSKKEFDAIMESDEKGDSFKAKANKAFTKLESVKAKLMQNRFTESLELREILTKEQLKKFNEMRQKHKPKFKKKKRE